MQPNYPINYRAGFLESSNEYIPQIKEPVPQWYTKNRLPDYGSVVDDDYQPTHFTHEPSHFHQKMNYTEPFHKEDPVTDFRNESKLFDLLENDTTPLKYPETSYKREPFHFIDTHTNQGISQKEWHQRKLNSITNMSHLNQYIHKLWNHVNAFAPNISEEDVITTLKSKLDSLPNESTRMDAEDLDELRDLGVSIPQRMNRSDTVRKAILRHIDKLESSNK